MIKKTYPSWSLSGRPKSKEKQTNPGPGSYSPKNIYMKTVPSFRITNGPINLSSKASFYPGPGSYELRAHARAKTVVYHLFRFGNSKRKFFDISNHAPGPGNYEVLDKSIEGPAFSMTGKEYKKPIEYPGPGAYQNTLGATSERAPTYRIGTAIRKHDFDGTKTTPGPGTYELKANVETPNWVFGRESRSASRKYVSPGPGTYNIPEALDKRGASFKRRYKPKSTDYSPGPGAYEFPLPVDAPKYRFGTSTKDKSSRNNFPGPGQYEYKSSILDTPSYFSTTR